MEESKELQEQIEQTLTVSMFSQCRKQAKCSLEQALNKH